MFGTKNNEINLNHTVWPVKLLQSRRSCMQMLTSFSADVVASNKLFRYWQRTHGRTPEINFTIKKLPMKSANTTSSSQRIVYIETCIVNGIIHSRFTPLSMTLLLAV